MKKTVLISCPPRSLREVFIPIIYQLGRDFNVVISMVDYFMPDGLIELLKSMVKNGLIQEYVIFPEYKYAIRQLFALKREMARLKPYNFDLWVTQGEMQLNERYLSECVLPEDCVRIIVSHNVTFLLEHEDLVRKLLSGSVISSPIATTGNPLSDIRVFTKRLREKVLEKAAISNILEIGLRLMRKASGSTLRRSILPCLIIGKAFPFGPYDEITQLGSGRADAMIFCDEIEAEAHKLLFKRPAVYVAQYPTYGNCFCSRNIRVGNAILSPLSGFLFSDEIPEKYLLLFFRDFEIVLSQTGATSIHLRLHPDETGKWPYQLRDYLTKRGIDALIVDSAKPIRDVMCGYLGMAGFASGALRDARFSCDNVLVIGFVAVSKFRYSNPKFVFGKSEGIGWIEEDGSYDQNIFSESIFRAPKRKAISDIVKGLAKN